MHFTTSMLLREIDGIYLRSFLLLLVFLFVEFAFLFGGGILVLLIFRHQVVHVRLGLSELHLVHALTSVPGVEKRKKINE